MTVEQWLGKNNQLGIDIWTKKYRYSNESFEEWLDRVSNNNNAVRQLIKSKKFLFGGRILANRGLQNKGRKVTFSNCFLPNQKVLTDKGYKNIQDICVGDKVLTHTNKYQTVNAVLQRDYQGEIYIITPRYGTGTVKCTPNHEFLTNRGWVRAEDLRVKSDNHAVRNGLRYDLIKIINPSDCTVDKKVFDLASISYDFNVEYDKDTISTTGIYKCGNNAKIKITSEKVKRYITIDKNLSYVIGRWLGDGCISSKKNQKLSIVQITFSKNEMSEVIKCKDILFEHFGLEFHIYENKKQNTIILRKENVILANALLKIFGRNVNDKRIPDIFFTKSDLSKSLLLGLIDSDGTFTKDGYIKLLSKNPQLVQQIAELSFVCSFPCNIKEVTQSYKKYKGYLISWSRLVSQNLKDNLNKYYKDNRLQQKYNVNNSIAIKTINGDYYTQIKSVKKEYYSGKVYNLSVEIDNSYNVNGLVVHNCYVITPPEDNIESIFDCAKKLARTYSYGGGCGIDISQLSPRGAKINNAAKETTGSVSFMDLYSLVTELIGQSGRRGALMLSIDCSHPDIEEFINIKSDLTKITKANISVRINDDFMKAVEENKEWLLTFIRKETNECIAKKVSAKELFNTLAKMNWDYAEPGILNWDRITKWNLLSEDKNFSYAGVNPCAEEPLPAGGSCLLGSINLSELINNPFTKNCSFDFSTLKEVVKQAVIGLNEVLHEGLPLHPLQEQRESVNNWRQIGLGIFGWHDALIKLGIRYGSKESFDLADKIGFEIANTAIYTSAMLTNKYGTYPMYNAEAVLNSPFFIANTDEKTKKIVKEKGLANSQLLTIAPTGSLGTMLGISTGIEPIYNISYTRKTESLFGKDEYYKVYTPIVEQYMKMNNISKEEDLPSFINTAMTLNYKERIEMQSVWQKHIDASISSTINVPNNFTVEEVEDLYILAWEKGLKGVTIFRDNCARIGILTNDKQKDENVSQEENNLVWGTTIQASDDLIGKKRKIMSGCGSLHVQAWFDPIDGRLTEIYLSKGSEGGCNSFMVALSRTISAGLRTGLDFNYAIDQLKSAPTCPSYAVRTATKRDTSKGNCCPAAIANALIEMQNEIYNELGVNEPDIEEIPEVNIKKTINKKQLCPECKKELINEGGCIQCKNCGWSKCE